MSKNPETGLISVDACNEIYRNKEYEIKRHIEDKFPDLDFSTDLSGTSLIDCDSEEIEIKVNSVDIIDYSLVHTDNSNTVSFELEAKVDYEANVSYESLEFATYDGEDDEYYGKEQKNEYFTQSINVSVKVTFILSKDKNYSLCDADICDADIGDADIEDITIDPNNTLGKIVIDTGLSDNY